MNPLEHPICLASPKHLTSVRSWHEHIPFAMFLIDVLRPRVFVELGTHAGDSYCAFCQAVRELNLDTRCYAIDTWKGDAHSGFYNERVLEDLKAHHDPLYGSFSSLIQSTFEEALCHFADGEINLLHIDGYHTYEAVKRDFELWLPKMSDDGIILFHDTNVRERDFGISRFWDEIKQAYPHFEFLHGHGLGLLAVGETCSPDLQSILNSSLDEAVKIRSFFFQLGLRLSLTDEVTTLQRKLSAPEDLVAGWKHHEDHTKDCLQLFWDHDGRFSEANSIEEPFVTDGRVTQHAFNLPATARGPLRLDPSNRPAYAEIHRMELYARGDQPDDSEDLLAEWSADDGFDRIQAVSGIVRLSGHDAYRFICVNEDPQLLLAGVPERKDARTWRLLVTLSATELFREVLTGAMEEFETEVVSKQQQLIELETQLGAARPLSDETSDRPHYSKMAQIEQQLQELQLELAAARAEYSERIDEKDRELALRSSELEQSRSIIVPLETQVERLQSDIGEYAKQLRENSAAMHSLKAELRARETSERELRADLVDKQSAADSARRELTHLTKLLADERERAARDNQNIQHLSSELQQRENTVRRQEHQLERITRSFGWRLLNRYGRIKYLVLLPAFRAIKQTLEILVRRAYRPSLDPIHDLRALDDGQGWESIGRDPQFNLSGKWPAGTVQVLVDIEPETAVSGHPRLYVDRGRGYSETESYDLGAAKHEQRTLIWFGPNVVALRLDPFESAGRFRVKALTFTPVLPSRDVNSKISKRSRYALNLRQFAQFARTRAESFRQKNGRAPGLRELPAAVRRTWRAWKQAPEFGSPPKQQPSVVSTAETSNTFTLPTPIDPYEAWLEVNEFNERRKSLLLERLSAEPALPLLSVVMPVYNPTPEFLDKAIASVANQVYQNWELCIADDASTDPAIREILRNWMDREPRIRAVFREQNGHISRATNSAAELAGGDYIALLDHDDELTPDALGEIALYAARNPGTDVLYSDDDKISAQGKRLAPQFKPDWSPEHLLSYMYFSHLFVIRRSLFLELDGLRVGYEGSQDYDLALRATERGRQVGHIPKVLYHWRVTPGSTALSGQAKPESFDSGLKAVQDALRRRGIKAGVFRPAWAIEASCGVFSHRFPDDGPRVAILIPTRNNATVLRKCIESISKTTYANYDVVIVDNESDDRDTLTYLKSIPNRVLRIPNPGKHFSFAAINNRAVRQVDADYVLFLNDDTEVITPEWLSQMVGYLGIPGTGAVGARLLLPDGRIQHAGIVHGYYNGMVGPAFKLVQSSDHGYMSNSVVARNYSAVTAACMLTPRDLFVRMGGFDEESFAVAYNDVDYCYRLEAAGHRVVYCGSAELVHHEGLSRGSADNPAEPAAFRKKYRGKVDRYYNPNLSLQDERFAIDARTVAPESLRPVRTLMCAFNLNLEGAPNSQFEMTVRLKETGTIEPLVYSPQDGPLRAAYERAGIEVEVFNHPLSGVQRVAAYQQALEGFGERIKKWNVELVYANTLQTFYAIDAARLLGLPSIWNPRESEPWQSYFDFLGPEISARALDCFRYPYKVVFVSNASRNVCAPLNSRHNFMTIHNGLDLTKFMSALAESPRERARAHLGVEGDQLMILSVGTVCDRKGQIDLVEAIGHLSDQTVQRIRCLIVGDRPGPYSDRLRAAHQNLSPSKRSSIEIIPETSEVAVYYSAADVLACTSRIESFPRVILEAMAAGLPIITTPVYGIVEQVQENINALFYQPGDARRLAERLEALLNQPDLKHGLARASRQVLDSLNDYEAMVSAYARVFREAWLSGRTRGCVGSSE